MYIDNFIDKRIEVELLAENEKQRAEHKSSGKLSASQLGQPLQWQILKVLGIEQRPLEEYVIRKFLRGNQVEDWLLEQVPDVIEKQKLAEYKGCIGYIDAIVDTKQWNKNYGIIPCEVKSVSNAKFKRIAQQGADKGHILQACYYALAENSKNFAIIYVSTDDYRVQTIIIPTSKYSKEVNEIIEAFDKQVAKKEIPAFEAKEKWQGFKQYNNYPEWAELNQEQINKKVKELKIEFK